MRFKKFRGRFNEIKTDIVTQTYHIRNNAAVNNTVSSTTSQTNYYGSNIILTKSITY